jgi:DNA polymerase IV (DinB-like DNA polymerase)
MDVRVIIHVDMDYFFAAVEERENPQLKGKPVVVCVYSGRGGGSGAVSTSNYIAREYGIKAGIPCSRARRLNPDAIFLPVNMELYRKVSNNVMDLLKGYADIFEQVSVDEAFLDISDSVGGDFNRVHQIAAQIKQDIMDTQQLTCSVGAGPNKLIAKIASGYNKPDGLTVITPERVSEFLKPLNVKELWGVGGKTEAQLTHLGINTIEQLAQADREMLVSAFGKNKGTWLADAARGLDDSQVQQRGESEQISRITTFKADTREQDLIQKQLADLVDDIYGKLKKRGVCFKTVTLTVITSDFKTHTKSQTLNVPSNNRDMMLKLSTNLLLKFLDENDYKIRRAGVRVSNLTKPSGQKSLADFLHQR